MESSAAQRICAGLVAGVLTLSVVSVTTVSVAANEFDPGTEIAAEDIPEGDAANEGLDDSVVEGDSDRQLRIAAETVHAFGSNESTDLKGFKPSLYRGKWYMPVKEERRRCIAKREAQHNYEAVSAGGIYRGTYQFSKELAEGASWMMQPEIRKEMGDAGLNLVQELRSKPMNQWNRYWQDRAFWTIWAKGRGSHHWRGGAYRC